MTACPRPMKTKARTSSTIGRGGRCEVLPVVEEPLVISSCLEGLFSKSVSPWLRPCFREQTQVKNRRRQKMLYRQGEWVCEELEMVDRIIYMKFSTN